MLGCLTGETRLEGNTVGLQSKVRLDEGYGSALEVIISALRERVVNTLAEGL